MRHYGVAVILLLVAACGGDSTSAPPTAAPVLARLIVALSTTAARSGERVTVVVRGFDQFDAPFSTPSVARSTSAPAVATWMPDGSVLTAQVGTATIGVSVGAIAASAVLTVTPGDAARLTLVRPAASTFNAWRFSVQPPVAVTDLAGNPVTTDAARVVRLNAPEGVIGTATATTTGGVATFLDAGLLAATGTTTVITFTAPGVAAVEQQVTVAPFTFGGGTRLVAVKFRPGKYRSVNPPDESCYWARLCNTAGSDDIREQPERRPAPAGSAAE